MLRVMHKLRTRPSAVMRFSGAVAIGIAGSAYAWKRAAVCAPVLHEEEMDELDKTLAMILEEAQAETRARLPARPSAETIADDDDDDDAADEPSCPSSPEQADHAESDSEDDVEELQVGKKVRHSYLGTGLLLAIGITKSVMKGVLASGETFESLSLPPEKSLFEFKKREKQKRTWRTVMKRRQVFTQNLAPVQEEAYCFNDAEDEPTAFDGMQAAAVEENAFTQGLAGPELAAHHRKRKLQNLKAAGVRGRNMKGRKTKEPKLDAALRVEQYPNQSLCVKQSSSTGLYCRACRLELSKRAVTVKTHVESSAHQQKLSRYISTVDEDTGISEIISNIFANNPDSANASLSEDVHIYRWRVMETLLYAGVPHSKIDMIRPLLEREGHALTNSKHMASFYIPHIEERETKRVVHELAGQYFTLVFDGTTRLGEAVNFVTRSMTDDFQIRMRLVAFRTTKVHLSGDALYRLIVVTLQRELGLDLDMCLSYTRDSCATNHDAVQRLIPLSSKALNMLCFPHTLHNTGKHLSVPVLEAFLTPWLQLVPKPGAAKLRWEAILGHGCATFSKVRWWSRWDVMQEIALNFGALPDFLRSLAENDIGDATTSKMQEIIMNNNQELKLQLAAVMSCERLYNATYRLEGDRLELLLVHRTIESLRTFGIHLGHDPADLPSVAALIRQSATLEVGMKTREWYPAPHSKWFDGELKRLPITTGAARNRKDTYLVHYGADDSEIELKEDEVRSIIVITSTAQWEDAVACVKEAYAYLERRITDDCAEPYKCSGPYEVCRVSQLFDPNFAAVELSPALVEELCAAVPALAQAQTSLKAEMCKYLEAAKRAPAFNYESVDEFTEEVFKFWKKEGSNMPAWRAAAKIIFSLTPNAACSERVFSLLESMFGKGQSNALGDLLQAALMLRYNKRSVG